MKCGEKWSLKFPFICTWNGVVAANSGGSCITLGCSM